MQSVGNRSRGRALLLAVPALTATAACLGAVPAASGAGLEAGAAAKQRSRVAVSLTGGPRRAVSVCGRQRRATVLEQGDRLSAAVRARRTRRGGRARRRAGRWQAVLLVDRCDGGRWKRARRLRLGRVRGKRRFRPAVATSAAGDYRVRAAISGIRRSPSRYAYFQVGENIADVALSFPVRNVNRSKLACPSDGQPHTVAARLVAPRSVLRGGGPDAVTLYVHEFGHGKWFWTFPDPRYDYARAMARAGHASVVMDRLGYDDSTAPEGQDTCFGSQADVVNQVGDQLRAGGYRASGASAPRFSKLALAGHSGGGAISEIAIYSFGEVDALMLFAYSDHSFTPRSIQEAFEQGGTCLSGTERHESGQRGGYGQFTQSAEEWKAFHFHSAEPAVQDRAAAMRNRDPCGDVASLSPAIASNQQNASAIRVPVFMVFGTRDAIYDQPAAGNQQRDQFTGSRDVTLHFLPETAHDLTLEQSAPRVQQLADEWLRARGF